MQQHSFLISPLQAFLFATERLRGRMLLMYLCIFVGNVASYSVPYFLKLIVDRIVEAPNATYVFSDFAPALAIAGGVIVSQEVLFRIGHIIEMQIVLPAYDRLTSSLYQMLLERPAAYFEQRFSGELSRRIEQIGLSTRFFIDFFPWELGWTVIAAIMTALLLRVADPLLMHLFLTWLLFFGASSYFLLRTMVRHTEIATEKQGNLSGTIVDVLGNASLVQAFAAQSHEYKHYRGFMNEALHTERRERIWGILNKFQQGISIVSLSIILLIASVWLFTRGQITVGDFVIIAATLPTFAGVIWSFGEIVIRALRNYGEMKNALEALRTDAEPIKEGSETLIVTEPSIVFKNVSFSYPGTGGKVLDNLSLTLKPGEKVGLVGRSGAGKSTIVRLLLHSYDTESGTISVSGQDITTVSLNSLRQSIAFVPQDTTLFHRSLYENILYARPEATREEVIEASRRAHAHDFIEEFPDGYETLVGERGVKLSGGQRQRIAIARAILKNAPILVLDEATSALDSESEGIVQEGLHLLFENRTVIAVAHRLSTLRSMDRIIVLEDGKVVEDGPPQELLEKRKGIFREMWEHQKKGFI